MVCFKIMGSENPNKKKSRVLTFPRHSYIICKHLFYAQRPCLSPAVLEERVLHARVLRRKLSLAMDKNGALGTPFKTQSSGLGKQTQQVIPSKIEWDLTNGPLSKLLELLHTQVFSGSVKRGSCGSDFLEINSMIYPPEV